MMIIQQSTVTKCAIVSVNYGKVGNLMMIMDLSVPLRLGGRGMVVHLDYVKPIWDGECIVV